jgi:hypothetical protein
MALLGLEGALKHYYLLLLVPQVVGAAVREEGGCGSAPGHSCLLEPVQTDFLTTGALLVHWWLHLTRAQQHSQLRPCWGLPVTATCWCCWCRACYRL